MKHVRDLGDPCQVKPLADYVVQNMLIAMFNRQEGISAAGSCNESDHCRIQRVHP